MDCLEVTVKDKKSVEVTFVADSDVLKIIKPFGIKYSKTEKLYSKTYSSPKVTRSGRKTIKNCSKKSESDESEVDGEEENLFNLPNSDESKKPSSLFDEEVAGNEVFGFNRPKIKGGMAKKASEVVAKIVEHNPKDPVIPKTPYSLRKNLKRKIKREAEKIEEDLFEWSESDYEPSSSSSDSSNESDVDDGITPLAVIPKKVIVGRTTSRRNHPAKPDYVFTSDDYFESQAGHKATSDHTLSKLSVPRLGQEQLQSLLSDYNPRHKSYIKALNKHTSSYFDRWLQSLREGFNIVVHGLGSKKTLLHWFHQTYLSSSKVLVVNGYFPGLTIKEVLDSLCELIGMKEGESAHEIVNYLNSSHKCKSRLFILIHNIDGPMLRSEKAQTVLSLLASHSRIHLIASIDHINAALLWDQKKLSLYNFIWEDGTCFLPYKEEINLESSLMVQRSGTLALAALKNVFQSLTNNSRSIFKIMLNKQLDSNNHNSGMPFSELYRACRTNFIVSSDLALRTQLTEFLDHQLLKWKKETDVLTIPIELNVLKQFKQEIDSEE